MIALITAAFIFIPFIIWDKGYFRAGVLEDQQRADQVRDKFCRKRQRQPEKRAAEQIKAV